MLNEKYTKFVNMKEGMKYIQPVLIVAMDDAVARTGNSYVKLKLSDGDTIIQANVFETTVERMYEGNIKEGTVVDVEMTIKEPYYNIANISITENVDVCHDDFIRTAPIDSNIMFEEIVSMIEQSIGITEEDFNLWQVTDEVLSRNREAYMTSSAAKTIHHAFKSGLIYHSYRMTKAAQNIAKIYSGMDAALLVCGAALHDIGKIRELLTNELGEATYTAEGRMFGHAVLGVDMIKAVADECNCNCEKVEMLKHIIASHHGKPEYGACVVPAIPEAVCVSMLDNLDAKLYQLEDALKSTEPGELSRKVFGLENCTAYKKT